MNFHLIRRELEVKELLQIKFYKDTVAEIKRIAEKEKIKVTHLIRAAVNDMIERYQEEEKKIMTDLELYLDRIATALESIAADISRIEQDSRPIAVPTPPQPKKPRKTEKKIEQANILPIPAPTTPVADAFLSQFNL